MKQALVRRAMFLVEGALVRSVLHAVTSKLPSWGVLQRTGNETVPDSTPERALPAGRAEVGA